jgi:hypothetical protein
LLREKFDHTAKALREEMSQQFAQIMSMIRLNPLLAYIKPEALKAKQIDAKGYKD